MSRRKYPRMGSGSRVCAPRPCLLCREPAERLRTVEVSYMRGDDELAACCRTCYSDGTAVDFDGHRLARRLIDALRATVTTTGGAHE